MKKEKSWVLTPASNQLMGCPVSWGIHRSSFVGAPFYRQILPTLEQSYSLSMWISYHVQFVLDLSGNGLEGFGGSLVVLIHSLVGVLFVKSPGLLLESFLHLCCTMLCWSPGARARMDQESAVLPLHGPLFQARPVLNDSPCLIPWLSGYQCLRYTQRIIF